MRTGRQAAQLARVHVARQSAKARAVLRGRSLMKALQETRPGVLVRRPADFVYPEPYRNPSASRRDLWECPKCGGRVKHANKDKHQAADECAFNVEARARRLNGWEVLDLRMLQLCVEAGVPMWPGPVRLLKQLERGTNKPLAHWNDQAEEGLWVPLWVARALQWSRHDKHLLRVGLLRYMMQGEGNREVVEAAFRLNGWEAVTEAIG